jgi:hypothetical protein
MAEYQFPIHGGTAKQKNVTSPFNCLVGGLIIYFAGIFHLSSFRSKVIQEFHACAKVKIFFNFFLGGGQI